METQYPNIIVLVNKDEIPINVIGKRQFVRYERNKNTIKVFEKLNNNICKTEVEIYPHNTHVLRAVRSWCHS